MQTRAENIARFRRHVRRELGTADIADHPKLRPTVARILLLDESDPRVDEFVGLLS
ncbi:MAG: hypothetical protein AAGA99_00575 [Actinomycetota bacterium]